MEHEVEGTRPRGKPKRDYGKDCQARKLKRVDVMNRNGWMKQIRDD